MSIEDNKALIRRCYEDALNGGRIETLGEYLAQEYVDHTGFVDRDGILKAISDFREAYSTITFEIEELFAEGDKVAVRSKITLKKVSETKVISQIAIYRISNGKIIEGWEHSDSFF